MTTKKTAVKSKKEPMCRTEIPDTLQSNLDEIGGIKGLIRRLPSKKRIEKKCLMHHALSDPGRMAILYLLAIQPLCVCVIIACTGITGPKLSYHLNILKDNGLIDGEQKGNWIIYRITDKGMKYVEESAGMV